MKAKRYSILVFICWQIILPSQLFAVGPRLPVLHQNGIKLNLLSPIYGNVSLTYQHLLNPYQSLQVNIGYMDFSDFTLIDPPADFRVQGISIAPEYRRNFTGYGLNGFYLGPFLRYMHYNRYITYQGTHSVTGMRGKFDEVTRFNSLGLGLTIGQQYIIKNKVLIDVFIGPVFQFLLSEKKDATPYKDYSTKTGIGYLGTSVPDRYLNGYGIRAGFTIGLAF